MLDLNPKIYQRVKVLAKSKQGRGPKHPTPKQIWAEITGGTDTSNVTFNQSDFTTAAQNQGLDADHATKVWNTISGGNANVDWATFQANFKAAGKAVNAEKKYFN